MGESNFGAAKWMVVGIVFMVAALPVRSQSAKTFSVPLTINENEGSFANFLIVLDQKLTGTIRAGKAPGHVLVSADRVARPTDAYSVRVDTNGDGNLDDERPVLLLPDSSAQFKIIRRWAIGEMRALPYTIQYSSQPGRNTAVRERLMWRSHYRAEGKIRVGECEALLVALDLNGDGLFDQEDFSKGSSIGLDRNGDGRIWGKEEWLVGNQIIEYCDKAFLITGIAANGTAITLAETTLRVPKLGAELPDFSLNTTAGKTINLRELKGQMYLLDFWASWCTPCVEKFSLVKQFDADYGKALTIIAINVDEEARLALAREVIKEYGLQWPHVMNGQGEADPLWKTFGGMEGNRLMIPLYVLVDSKGVLRYAGNGGADLSELRQKIEEAKK